jgi:hypothetical protein
MTPAERQLVTNLFDRLAALEDAPRDRDAEQIIRDGLSQAPNAVYALVQTALVQDEALKRANTRIQELEAELGAGNAEPPRKGGFLDNMRDNIFGRREEPRGSVPNVSPGGAPSGSPAGFQMGAQPIGSPGGYAPAGAMPEPSRGGSFLGTAAAAAAGAIGGSLLLNGIRGAMGGHRPGSGFGMADPAAATESRNPWGNSAGSGGGMSGGSSPGGDNDLARALGRDDIGRSGGQDGDREQRQGLFSDAGDSNDADNFFDDNDDNDDDDDDSDFDDGGGFDGSGDC